MRLSANWQLHFGAIYSAICLSVEQYTALYCSVLYVIKHPMLFLPGSIFFYSTPKLAFLLTKSIVCIVISECQVGQFLKLAQMAPIVCNVIWNVKLMNRSSETNSVSFYVSPI